MLAAAVGIKTESFFVIMLAATIQMKSHLLAMLTLQFDCIIETFTL